MSKKLVTITILSAILVSGEMIKRGEKIEVNESIASQLISRGKATKDDIGETENEEELSFFEMTLEELKEVNYKALNKDLLVEYARACGLEVNEETKPQIIELLKTVNFDEE